MSWATSEPLEQTPVRPPRRWLRRTLWGFAAFAVLVAALTAVVWAWFSYRWNCEIDSLLAEARERGEPVTLAEFDALYVPPLGEDATPLWQQAFDELHQTAKLLQTRYDTVPIVGIHASSLDIPVPPAAWAEQALTEDFLQDSAAAMQALHKAADFGGRARFTESVDPLIATEPPRRIFDSRDGARRLMLESYVRAHNNDAAGVADSLHASFMLCEAIVGDPLRNAMNFRLALWGMPVYTLRELLPAVPFSDADLQRLQNDLAAIDFRPQLYQTACAYRLVGLDILHQMQTGQMPTDSRLPTRLVALANEVLVLQIAAESIEVTRRPWAEMASADRAVDTKFVPRLTWFQFMTREAYPHTKIATETVSAEASRQLAILSLALERYRRREGKPAPELAALVPEYLAEIPADPTTGEDFHYKLTEAGYVVFSPSTPFHRSARPRDAETGADLNFLFQWPPLPPADAQRETVLDADSGETNAQ